MIDQNFREKIIAIAGEAGRHWLAGLPEQIRLYEERWHLQCSAPFALSYNYVAPAKTTTGEDVVLKISFPNNHEFLSEIKALQLYGGQGSIQVLQHDIDNKVVILERALPGTRIGAVKPDKRQISIVSEVLRKIHTPISPKDKASFPSLSDWGKAFQRYRQDFSVQSGPIPKRMFEEAEEIFAQYTFDNQQSVLLHGDLHNDNILLSDRGWLVIDPKGVIGDRAFDVGTYLRNPYADLAEGSNYKEIVKSRMLQFSEELGLESKQVQRWTFANAIISLLWSLEDEKKLSDLYLRNAELISEIRL
jgi:streptomycin 6-kinase